MWALGGVKLRLASPIRFQLASTFMYTTQDNGKQLHTKGGLKLSWPVSDTSPPHSDGSRCEGRFIAIDREKSVENGWLDGSKQPARLAGFCPLGLCGISL